MTESGDQLLALKGKMTIQNLHSPLSNIFPVMRLTRPMLVAPQIISCEPSSDLPQQSYQTVLQNDPTVVSGCETGLELGSGQFMLLPQSFGNIYLGETFSSYICVHNCTTYQVEGVVVKADLKSNNSHITLPLNEKQQNPIILGPDDTFDDVIHYEVKECGTHM